MSAGIENSGNNNGEQQPERRFFRLKYFIVVMVICAIVPLAAAGWTDLYKTVLEHNAPVIDIVEAPRGVGLTPVTVTFRVSDPDSGLDEAVVRVRQRGPLRELKRLKLNGKKTEEITISLDGENSDLDEGTVTIEVRAFDRSFWNNASEIALPLRVDYRRPKIEVVSTQHNARHGGSQLLFYRAYDEDLAISGVRVGNRSFFGFPATGIDKELKDPSLFVVIYGIALDQDPKNTTVRVFAEDKVGNAVSTSFYNKVSDRPRKTVQIPLSEDFLRERVSELADLFRSRIARGGGLEDQVKAVSPRGSRERLVENFAVVNEKLRIVNENEIVSLLTKSPRHESLWTGPFARQAGSMQVGYGDRQSFTFEGSQIGFAVSQGEEILPVRDQQDIGAAGPGIVTFAESLGVYGWTVGVDHGLGLVSVYSHLNSVAVRPGENVETGQVVGYLGNSGLARNRNLYFEMRIQGVPVDPREWWDSSWFYNHIVDKVNDVKKSLGIPVYIPLK